MAQFLLVINTVLQLQSIFTKESAGVRRQLCGKDDGGESVLAVLIFHLSGPGSAEHLTTCLILGAWVIPSLQSKVCVSFSLTLMGLHEGPSNLVCWAWHFHHCFHLARHCSRASALSLCRTPEPPLLCNPLSLMALFQPTVSSQLYLASGKMDWEQVELWYLFRTFLDQNQPTSSYYPVCAVMFKYFAESGSTVLISWDF